MVSRWFSIGLLVFCAACELGGIQDEHLGQAPAVYVPPVVLHRLNALEYDNTVHDLLGTSLQPANAFPQDATAAGFDNMAPALSLSPTQVSMYSQAAQSLADDALDARPQSQVHWDATQFGQGGSIYGSGYSVGTPISVTMAQAQNDTLTLSLTAGGWSVSAAVPQMALSVDGGNVAMFTVTAPGQGPVAYSAPVPLDAGPHTFTVTFVNPAANDPGLGTGNGLYLYSIDLVSQTIQPAPNRARVYACDPNDPAQKRMGGVCWLNNLNAFAQNAWRRPLTGAERSELQALWQSLATDGGSDASFKLAMQAVLMSSKFLFRPSDARVGSPNSVGAPLDDYALASRLSYFLWSSMPDAQLLKDAQSQSLRTDAGLRAEVARMLADPRAAALQVGFAAQWLDTRALAQAAPDPNTYPAWNAALGAAMAQEAQDVFADFVHNGRPITDMLTPGFTYANSALAAYYNIADPASATPVKVPLADNRRGGLLTQGAWLVATSLPTRTSPVKRGRWVLENLLCTQLPEPPNVPPLPPATQNPNSPPLTMRQQLAMHVNNASCAGCHKILDPLGFGLEGFDGAGAVRTLEVGQPVDTSGQLPNGQTFTDVVDMASKLQQSSQFSACVVQKLASYALGRPLTDADGPFISSITSDLATQGGSLDTLITLIVLSPPFRLVNTESAP